MSEIETLMEEILRRGKEREESKMLCPSCGTNLVHPHEVSINPPGKLPGKLTISANWIGLDPTVAPEGRGVQIVLSFHCESGCLFDYVIHFHKGTTYVTPTVHRVLTGDEMIGLPTTLWRD